MPGGKNTVRGVVGETDDRREAFLPVKTAFLGTVLGVGGGDGVMVVGSPSTDTSREGKGRDMALGYHCPWWRAIHL